jgi:hypothetical protein
MPKPERLYFFISEVIKRWQISFEDLRYYAEHDIVQIIAWLSDVTVKTYEKKKTEDGHDVEVPQFIRSHNNYVLLTSDELRKIFKHENSEVIVFIDFFTGEILKPHHCVCYIKIADLMMSKKEMERFEQANHILPSQSYLEGLPSPSDAPSFSGRPSVMHHIITHFEDRLLKDLTAESVQQESIYLSLWAKKNLNGVQTPTPKTIANAIRSRHRQFRRAPVKHVLQNT